MNETILGLALVGSRARGFNHDAASKLQRLMMALSEAEDLAGPDASPDQRITLDSLHSALTELEALFAEFRALAKGSELVRVRLAEVLDRAARSAHVTLVVELDPELTSVVQEPELVQALAHLFDAAEAGGVLAITGKARDHRVELVITPVGGDLAAPLGLVGHVVGRTGGTVVRDGATVRITL